MKDHENTKRAFVYSSQAWYADSINREDKQIMFGMYAGQDGGTSGEMAMQ